MAQTTFVSYDQQGKKLSFANWISMISPQDTPFVSMTGKESINQTIFSWQVDALAAVNPNNAVIEGSAADQDTHSRPTQVKSNVTQILRKVVKVSDTANTTANYGRGRELMYQLEKAGKEIKRDLEVILLSAQKREDLSSYVDPYFASAVTPYPGVVTANTAPQVGSSLVPNSPVPLTPARKTGAFQWLCATKKVTAAGATQGDVIKGDGDVDVLDTQATTVLASQADPATIPTGSFGFTEADLFRLTLELYKAGSEANIIMINPAHASAIASLQENTQGSRQRIFENVKSIVLEVNSITDPLGQQFKVVVNRWMPVDAIYVFSASDWTQMVLRAPQRTELAKDGSYEKWMIEMEVGLRHRNPFASGILYCKAGTK